MSNNNSKSGGLVLSILSFLASAAVAYFLTSVYLARQPAEGAGKAPLAGQKGKSATVSRTSKNDTPAQTVKPAVQITVMYSTPVETSRNVYKFNAYTNLEKSVPVKYELYVVNNKDTVVKYTSNDGSFKNVAARNSGYLIRAIVNKPNDKRISRYVTVTGFPYHAEHIDKLSVEEVRNLIVDRKADSDSHFSRNVKLNFVNKKEPDNIVSFEKVGQQLMFKQWKDIVVKDLSFTTDNHIREVTIEIIYP